MKRLVEDWFPVYMVLIIIFLIWLLVPLFDPKVAVIESVTDLAPSSEAKCFFRPSVNDPIHMPKYDCCFTADGRVANCPTHVDKLPLCK